MKRMYRWISILMIAVLTLPQTAWAAELLVPGGSVVALEVRSGSVTVAAFDDTLGASAREGGLRVGDEILKIDGDAVTDTGQVREALKDSRGDVELIVSRGGKRYRLVVTPVPTAQGPMLGVYLRQGITGIGTVTYYDPQTHSFGALGHGVSDGKGTLLEMTRGNVYDARVVSVVRGKAGTPGQLKGSAEAGSTIGVLEKNTSQGVFGTSRRGWLGQALPVAEFDEVTTGAATIRSTIAGDGVQEYSVEILKIYPQDRPDGRNFLLKVTDEALLNATGGIVQGMSGSPIIQDGKLIGAVTHVLVNDPTTGYGIFIENMLDAAG